MCVKKSFFENSLYKRGKPWYNTFCLFLGYGSKPQCGLHLPCTGILGNTIMR